MKMEQILGKLVEIFLPQGVDYADGINFSYHWLYYNVFVWLFLILTVYLVWWYRQVRVRPMIVQNVSDEAGGIVKEEYDVSSMFKIHKPMYFGIGGPFVMQFLMAIVPAMIPMEGGSTFLAKYLETSGEKLILGIYEYGLLSFLLGWGLFFLIKTFLLKPVYSPILSNRK